MDQMENRGPKSRTPHSAGRRVPGRLTVTLLASALCIATVGCGAVPTPGPPKQPSQRPTKHVSKPPAGTTSKTPSQQGPKAVRGGSSGKTKPSAPSPTTGDFTSMPDASSAFQNLQNDGTSSSGAVAVPKPAPNETLQAVVKRANLKPTLEQIVDPVVATLQSLQSQYIGQLYALYGEAKNEYHTAHVSKLQVERKYIPLVINLENSAQDQLNAQLFSLRDKLQSHGYPTTEVDTLRSAYYAEVAKLEGSLRH